MSRHGIAEKILTDQDTNFMSNLITQLKEKLDITGIQTSPYYPQCNGLVERLNATIKTMIKKVQE